METQFSILFILISFTFLLYIPTILIVGLFVVIKVGRRNAKNLELKQLKHSTADSYRAFSLEKGYKFVEDDPLLRTSGYYAGSQPVNRITGMLRGSGLDFTIYQQIINEEIHREPKSRKMTVAEIKIPNTNSQLIALRRFDFYRKSLAQIHSIKHSPDYQKIRLPDQFNKHSKYRPLEVYLSRSVDSNILLSLNDEVINYLNDNQYIYDIEINNDKLYIYLYRLVPKFELQDFIHNIDSLAAAMRLNISGTYNARHTTSSTTSLVSDNVKTIYRRVMFNKLKWIFLLAIPALGSLIIPVAYMNISIEYPNITLTQIVIAYILISILLVLIRTIVLLLFTEFISRKYKR